MYLKLTKRIFTLALTVFMFVNMLYPSLEVKVSANDQLNIASWDYTEAVSSPTLPATSGDKKLESQLSLSGGRISTGFSAGSLASTAWDNGADSKYWQLRTSTAGYENVTLSLKSRSSNTGPKDFNVIYSIDGGTEWSAIESFSHVTGQTTLAYYLPQNLVLPEAAWNQPNVLIRVQMATNISLNNGVVAAGGVTNINNVNIYGDALVDESITGAVEAVPGTGEILLGQHIQLTSDTTGATIYYTIDGGAEMIYDQNEMIKVESLPMTLVSYAKAEGLKDSITKSFQFTQARVQNITASPNGGAVLLNSKVSLATRTDGATIKYSFDNVNWETYTGSIALETLPGSIFAYAEKDGMINSAVSEFKYTERENENFNIYFGQLHSHTNNSDGLGSLDEAFDYAKNMSGVDFLAVTDHSNSFDGDLSANINNGSMSTKWQNGINAATKYTDETFIGMYAYEMTWSNGIGHLNTFNTNGFESRNHNDFKQPDALKRYYDRLKTSAGSISQMNHPGATFGDFNDFAHYDSEIDELISLIEVGNGEGAIRSSGYFTSYEYYTRALDKGWHVAPSNNQDNHKAKWGNANTARTVILADTLSEVHVYDALKNRRTYATEDENLKIYYTLNGEVMGTILEDKPTEVNISVDLEDPDGENIGTVYVISNGGKVAAQKKVNSSKETVEFTLPATDSYYYIKVVQEDRDIAVTAPVWIGDVEKAGVSKSTTSTTMPIKDEEFSMSTDFFNNEKEVLTIDKITYSINNEEIHVSTEPFTVGSLDTKGYTFNYTPTRAGKYNVNVTVEAKLGNVAKVYTDVIQLDVADPNMISRVLIDATHYNDYVAGYYANNMGNFTQIANGEGFSVNIEHNEITREMLANTELLVITAPAKKAGNVGGVSYDPQSFTAKFIEMVAEFAANGGSIIVTALASFQDGVGEFTSSEQLNNLLEGMGATTRINKDQAVDDDEKVNNQNFRLAFDDYNMESKFLKGIQPEQKYSFYSGSTVQLDPAAVADGSAFGLVYGHETTYSNDPKTSGTPVIVEKGDVVALAAEKLSGGGHVFVGGTVFISNFEVKAALDNASDLQYSNYNIVLNILEDVVKELPVTKIEDVVNAKDGEMFVVEGFATASTIDGNAFFDSMYIQDETGGINLFPVSGINIKLGQKLRVVGSLSSYEGERQLNVSSFEVIDTNVSLIKPLSLSTKDAMSPLYTGTLLHVEGVITSINYEVDAIESIMIKDASGEEARIFINGYIGYTDATSTPIEEIAVVGNTISVIGLGSVDTVGPRLRVRDRSEITLVETTEVENPTVNPDVEEEGQFPTPELDDPSIDTEEVEGQLPTPELEAEKDAATKPPGTGVSNSVFGFVFVMMISGAAVLLLTKKKEQN